MPYQVTKHYGHDLGLSAAFRQWRAQSHCRFIHGYALAFTFTFEGDALDERNWLLDFGALAPLKHWLVETFDHRLLIAEDDPEIDLMLGLKGRGLANPIVLADVGCEAFARLAYVSAEMELRIQRLSNNPRVVSVKCSEHGANSATYVA